MRVVTLGEMLLRLSPPATERLFQSPELRVNFGGSEANVAVGLAHFGLTSEYVTRLPSNSLGEAAIRALRAEGVSVEQIQHGGERLGVYYVEPGAELRPMRVVYDRGHSAFTQVGASTFDWLRLLPGAACFHLSGITPGLSAGAAACASAAISAARGAGVRVSFDLNYRAALWEGRDPAPVIRPLVAQADLVIGSLAAVAAMLGERAAEGPDSREELARRLAASLGCTQVALTEREQLSASEHCWSAVLFDARRDALWDSLRYRVRLVDRVGGGDSFAAALIYATAAGRPEEEALQFAVAAGALKLTIPGDWNRVSADEVDQVLAEARGR